MNRSVLASSFFVLGLVVAVAAPSARAQFGNSPEAQAARQKQLAIEANAPKLQVTEEMLPLVVPGHTIGETEGVAKNSKGHLFVYSRTGYGGSARAAPPRNYSSSTRT